MCQKYPVLVRILKQKLSEVIVNKVFQRYKLGSLKSRRIFITSLKEEIAKSKKTVNMVTILVFDGAGKADLEKFLRHVQRARMANGDRDNSTCLELLSIHLGDEASWCYESQTEEIKTS
jgi:hypothetical protein